MEPECLLVAVAAVEQVAEVVVGAQGRGGQVVLEGEPQRVRDQCPSLLEATARACDQALGVQRIRENVGEPERFGNLDRRVDPLGGEVDLALEEVKPAELGGERCQVGVELVAGENRERLLHPLDRFFEPAQPPLDHAEARRRPRRRMRQPLSLVELERPLEVRLRLLGPSARPGVSPARSRSAASASGSSASSAACSK